MNRHEPEPTLHDDAARAGWLYYVGGLTQDQIATELGVSRQRAQRLVSRAMAEGLIQVRLNHRIGACLELEAALTSRFQLTRCRVAPGLGPGVDPARAVAPAAAAELERVLRMPTPQVIAFGYQSALFAVADAEEHLELEIRGCPLGQCGESEGGVDHGGIVGGHHRVSVTFHQDLQATHVRRVDFGGLLERDAGRFLVCTLAQPNS